MCTDETIAESTAFSIVKYDGMDFKSSSLGIHLPLEQHLVLGIADRTERTLDMKDRRRFEA
jgi:hypothetical protein